MLAKDLKRKEELLALSKRRKHELDKQAALFGAISDPSINIQREELEKEIEKLEKDIEGLMAKLFASSTSKSGAEIAQSSDVAIGKTDATSSRTNVNKRTNLITAVVFLIIAVVLFVWPQSLGVPTVGIAGFFALFGFFALGIVMERRIGGDGLNDIFGGIGFLFVPVATYYYAGLTIRSIVPLTLLVSLAIVGIATGVKKRRGMSSS
jgi:hypothetical protein